MENQTKPLQTANNSAFKNLVLVLTSVFLTATTFIFGAVSLRALNMRTNKLTYWFICFFTALILLFSKSFLLGVSFMVIAFLIGLFSVFEERGYSLESASLVSLFISGFVMCGSYLVIYYQMGEKFILPYKQSLTMILEKSTQETDANIALLVDDLIQRIPSGLIMSLMVALVLALLMERRLSRWVKSPNQIKYNLEFFKLPSFFVWVFILSLFGSFYKYPEGQSFEIFKMVSVNTFYVVLFSYFFQGLSIVFYFYKVYNVSPIWRVLWTVLLVLQLFVVVCAIGVTDFWFNYRLRLAKKTARTNKNGA